LPRTQDQVQNRTGPDEKDRGWQGTEEEKGGGSTAILARVIEGVFLIRKRRTKNEWNLLSLKGGGKGEVKMGGKMNKKNAKFQN